MAKRTLQLGRPTPLPTSPDKARLDRVANPHSDTDYVARFTCPEFTCLCPITGQPDFGTLLIRYVPAARCVELKNHLRAGPETVVLALCTEAAIDRAAFQQVIGSN